MAPSPLSWISGLSFDSPFLGPLLFFILSCHFSANGQQSLESLLVYEWILETKLTSKFLVFHMYHWRQGGSQQIEQQSWNSLPSFFPATSAQGAAPLPHPPTPAKVSSVHQVTSAWRGRSLRKAVQSEHTSPITDSPTAPCAQLVSCALTSTWHLPTRAWRVSCLSVSKWVYCCQGLTLCFFFALFSFSPTFTSKNVKIEDIPVLTCLYFCHLLCSDVCFTLMSWWTGHKKDELLT